MSSLFISCSEQREDPVHIRSEIKQIFTKADAEKSSSVREKMIDSAYSELQSSGNDSIRRSLLFNVAVRYEELGASEKYLAVCKSIHAKARQQKDTTDWAQASSWIGDYYQAKMQSDSAFKYYLQSEKMYRLLKDTLNYGRAILNKSVVLYHTGNFSESIVQGVESLKSLKNTKDQQAIYSAYVKIALSLKEVKDYEKALEYFNLSFTELKKLENTPDFPEESMRYALASNYNNIGTIYERLGDYKQAIHFYDRGLRVVDIYEKWPRLYAMLLNNLAYAKMKSGNNTNVESLLFRALRIRDSIETLPGIVSSKVKIGEYYLLKKDTARALQNFREGFDLSVKIQVSAEMLQTLKLLTENDTKKKAYYSDLYFKISDSVQNVERATQNKFARIAYETGQIEEENQLLSRRNKIIIVVSFFILLFSFASVMIFRLRLKNKELLYIKEQQEANETIYQLILQQQSETQEARNEERNRIAMELHDGIVNSIFTTRFNLMQLDTEALEKKEMLIRELEKTEQEVRKVSHDLQKSLFFEDKNLPEILGNLVAAQQNHFHTEFDLSVDKYIDWSNVSGANKIHVYRIVQEAIQNVNKYSHAKRCLIMVLKTDGKITVRIWDNGSGFNPDKVKEGIGLRNIRSRAEAMNGALRIVSGAKTGTTIEVVF